MRHVLRMLSLALFFCLLSQAALAAQQERRVALVIGNSAYKTARLRNPVNDATDMAAALRRVGFEVTLVTDATLMQMEQAVRDFGRSLRQGGVGLFYYAGHGVQVGGENYLIPVNAAIASESDVKYGCLNAGVVLGKMEDAGNGLNLVILDACRSNPFSRGFRSTEQGLAKMDAPTGSIIAYSTAPGSVASDGVGRNGVYTRNLLKVMNTPGIPVEEVFKEVRVGVVQETAKKQVPWESSSLIGNFYFTPPSGAAVVAPAPAPAPPQASVDQRVDQAMKPPVPDMGVAAPAPAAQPSGRRRKTAPAVQAPGEAQAASQDKAREDWAAWQQRMNKAVAEAQALEQRKDVSAADKAASWQRVGAVYSSENPYSDEAKALRQKIAAQTAYWGNEARREDEARKRPAGPAPQLAPDDLARLAAEGEQAYAASDYARALQILAPVAGQGNAKAQGLLGVMHLRGLGTAPNPAEALKWLRPAAQAGDPRAQTALGVAYADGAGVGQSLTDAVRWFRLAAEQGYPAGQAWLGWMYASGGGLPRDGAEGLKWLQLSVRQNDPSGQYLLGMVYAGGQGVAQDMAEAAKWYRLAADQGFARAQANLGVCFLEGQGVKRDPARAYRLFTLAAEQGDDQALLHLGLMNLRGTGVVMNYAEAVRWLTPSAQQGNAYAAAALGWMYYKGMGVPADKVLAYQLFSQAVAGGFGTAKRDFDTVAGGMTPAELAEARNAAAAWRRKSPTELGYIQKARN